MKVGISVGHQFQWSSDLYNLSFLHHTNSVTGEDGVQPVGDGHHGAVGELALYEARHLLVRHHVHGGGGLVQDQQFGVPGNISIVSARILHSMLRSVPRARSCKASNLKP